MNVGCSVIARISATTISTLSVPMPVDTQETRRSRYMPVATANSRCRFWGLHRVEQLGHFRGPILVPGQEDVLAQVARSAVDVVLHRSVRKRDASVLARHLHPSWFPRSTQT